MFSIEKAIELEELNFIESLQNKIITAEQLFIKNQEIKLTEKQLQHFINGVKMTRRETNGIYRIYNENSQFIGLGKIKEGYLKREYVE